VRLAAIVLLAGCSNPPEPLPVKDAAVSIVKQIDAAVVVDAATPPTARAPIAKIDRPMKWSDARAELTLAYRKQHSDPDAKDLVIAPRVIVLHYTVGNSATGTLGYFDNLKIEASRPDLARAGAVNVSAHYVVDRDGTIYQAQPDTRFARHCIGLNHLAIGIENVGDEKEYPLTDAQVTANAALVRDLAARFEITHLLGHYEVMKFREHAYYVERDRGYKNTKPDPGPAFMRKVRAKVADLGLSGL
jgi:N-acetylmuramoyl-L-alanine amidase